MHINWIIAKALKILLRPPALRNCKTHKYSFVASLSELTNCSLGRYTYIGYNCFMVNTHIGSFCSIADNVSIGGATHPMNYVSTSPVFHEGRNALHKNYAKHKAIDTPPTVIKNDVWIGRGVFIKSGVVIENGAVIGMGAVVTNNVGPYEIWAGNPAKLIRKRFDDATINALLRSAWWNVEDFRLNDYAELFNDPQRFIKYCDIAKEE